MSFDFSIRPRRLRENSVLREMIAENSLTVNDLIFPVFVSNEIRDRQEISSMPGIYRWSLPSLLKQIPEWIDLGIRAFHFPCVEKEMKDETGSEILNLML